MKISILVFLAFLISFQGFSQSYPSLDLTNSGDGALLLNFNIERPWAFKQTGSGAFTNLQLHNHSGPNKHFQIKTDGGVQFLNQSDNVNSFFSANGGNSYIGIINGFLGVGTSSPSDQLEVKGNTIRITDGADDDLWNRLVTNSNGTFAIKNPSGVNHFVINGNQVGIGTNSPSDKLEVKGSTIRITDGADDNLWNRLVTNSDGTFSIKNPSGVDHFVINGNQVGIGTNSPASKLDISGSGDGAELLRLSTERPWVFRQANTGGTSQLDLHSTVSDKSFKITSPNDNIVAQFHVSDNVASSKVLLVPDGGKVGIGTTTFGSHSLAVDGSVGARKITVEASGWSDFVFEQDYELQPLGELENFITQNKHLPEVPSETEVIEKGINLGEMDAKLLQKIEELTLYLIEQNKKIEELQKEVTALKSE